MTLEDMTSRRIKALEADKAVVTKRVNKLQAERTEVGQILINLRRQYESLEVELKSAEDRERVLARGIVETSHEQQILEAQIEALHKLRGE